MPPAPGAMPPGLGEASVSGLPQFHVRKSPGSPGLPTSNLAWEGELQAGLGLGKWERQGHEEPGRIT